VLLLQEQLLRREHRKETKTHRKQEREMQIKAGLRPAPGSSAAAAASDGAAAAAAGLDEEDTVVAKGLIISYCALDYPRIVDSVRWRLATVRKNLQVTPRTGSLVTCTEHL
jgi:hypothetical protein